MAIPKWAQELVLRVALDEGREELPDVTWRRNHRRWPYSSGHTKHGSRAVVVTAGTSLKDQRLVLLHELAHWLIGTGHTDTFWDKAWTLYRRYKVQIRWAKAREGQYRKGSIAAYRRNRRKEYGG